MTGNPFADSQRPSRVRNIARIVGKFAGLTLAMIVTSLVVAWIAFPQTREPIEGAISAIKLAVMDSSLVRAVICQSDFDCHYGTICVDGDCMYESQIPSNEVCVTFSREHDLNMLVLKSDVGMGEAIKSADQPKGSRKECGEVKVVPGGYLKVNVQIDGGNGSSYLAFNDNATRCSLFSTLDRITVDGTRIQTVTALPWHCENDPAACKEVVPDPDEGCDAWVYVDH